MTAIYDIVIIAAPLTGDQEFPIEFVNLPENLEFPGGYQTTHVTFIKADIKPKYFGLHESLDDIFSCNATKTMISVVGKVSSVNASDKNGSSIWKIFSRKPLKTDLIHEMFSNVRDPHHSYFRQSKNVSVQLILIFFSHLQVIEKKTLAWKAYPHYLSNTHHSSFKLYDALYHVNAIEWVGSAMEMSAISGRNVAILAYNDFLQKHGLMQHKEASKDTPKRLLKEL